MANNIFLDKLADEIKRREINIFKVSEYKDGKIDTVCINPANPCQNIYSVVKAWVVTAFGWLYDRGQLDFDRRVTDIFPEYRHVITDERFHDMTVHHVLSHQCGFKNGYLDCDRDDVRSFGNPDLLEHILSLKLECAPGEKYSYSDAAYYLALRIFNKLSGRRLEDVLNRTFFYKMGFFEYAWAFDPHGFAYGATGLYIRNEDMVKLGALYLQNGNYEGRWYLTKEWCDIVRERKYELAPVGYGDFYGKGGFRGQQLLIMPERGCVLAYQAFEEKKDHTELFPWIYAHRNI